MELIMMSTFKDTAVLMTIFDADFCYLHGSDKHAPSAPVKEKSVLYSFDVGISEDIKKPTALKI